MFLDIRDGIGLDEATQGVRDEADRGDPVGEVVGPMVLVLDNAAIFVCWLGAGSGPAGLGSSGLLILTTTCPS